MKTNIPKDFKPSQPQPNPTWAEVLVLGIFFFGVLPAFLWGATLWEAIQ